MAGENLKKNLPTIIMIVVALLILAGIIGYAFMNKPATNTSTGSSNSTNSSNDNANAAAVDKLGPREVKITPDNFDSTVSGNKLVLIDVYSPTCPHCQKMAPILTDLSNQYGDKLVVGKMSTADSKNVDFVVKKFTDFQYVPLMILYKDGQQVEKFTGERTVEEMKAMIDKNIQ